MSLRDCPNLLTLNLTKNMLCTLVTFLSRLTNGGAIGPWVRLYCYRCTALIFQS